MTPACEKKWMPDTKRISAQAQIRGEQGSALIQSTARHFVELQHNIAVL
jgi:hypothetical protein